MPAPRLKDLVLLARQQADQEISNFCNEREVTAYLNNGVSSLHDLVVQKYEDYIVKELTWASSLSSTGEYTFTAIGMTDFYKSLGVDIETGGSKIRLRPYSFLARHKYDVWPGATVFSQVGASQYHILGDRIRIIPAPVMAGTVRWFYVPVAFQFDWTQPEEEIGYSYAFAPGWEEYITLYAAIRMVRKEGGMTNAMDLEIQALKRRIEEAGGKRDAGESWAIADVHQGTWGNGLGDGMWGWWP